MLSVFSTGFTIVFGIATYTNTLPPHTGGVLKFSPTISLNTVTNLLCGLRSNFESWAEVQFHRTVQTSIGIWRLEDSTIVTPSGLTVYYQNMGY